MEISHPGHGSNLRERSLQKTSSFIEFSTNFIERSKMNVKVGIALYGRSLTHRSSNVPATF